MPQIPNDQGLVERMMRQLYPDKYKQEQEDPQKKSNVIVIAEDVSLKKKAKIPAIKPKIPYEVRLEALVPATVIYRVSAETPEIAFEMTKNTAPITIKPRIQGKRDLKVQVVELGSSIIRWVKSFA